MEIMQLIQLQMKKIFITYLKKLLNGIILQLLPREVFVLNVDQVFFLKEKNLIIYQYQQVYLKSRLI